MKLKKFIVTILIYGSLFGGVNLVLAYTLVNQMEGFFQEGLLDIVGVSYSVKGEIAYEINGNPITHFDKYGEALRLGKEEQLLYADNGLALKRNSPIGKQFYVIDYSWLPKGRYDEQDVKEYVKDNRLIMILRSAYLTDSVMYGTLLFSALYGLSYYLVPSILVFLANIYIFFKGRKVKGRDLDYDYSDLAKSMLVKLMNKKYEKTWDMPLIIGIISYFVSSTNVVNTIILGSSSYAWVGLLYIAIITSLCLHYLQQVYMDIDLKRLEAKMLHEDAPKNKNDKDD